MSDGASISSIVTYKCGYTVPDDVNTVRIDPSVFPVLLVLPIPPKGVRNVHFKNVTASTNEIVILVEGCSISPQPIVVLSVSFGTMRVVVDELGDMAWGWGGNFNGHKKFEFYF